MTSPYAFYQYWLNVEDASVVTLLKVFTDRTREQVADLEIAVAERPFAREAQRTLATDVTTLVHGSEATAAVQAASAALFGKAELSSLDARTLADAVAELPGAQVDLGTPVAEAFAATGLSPSRGAARRTVTEGGAYVNNAKVTDAEAVLGVGELLYGRYAVLRRGKKSLAVATVAPQATARI
jgi:tyrosyl-tRNA synthetase